MSSENNRTSMGRSEKDEDPTEKIKKQRTGENQDRVVSQMPGKKDQEGLVVKGGNISGRQEKSQRPPLGLATWRSRVTFAKAVSCESGGGGSHVSLG